MSQPSRRVELLHRAWRNRALRRLALANAAFRLAELGVWIAFTAYIYETGGVGAASAVMVLQLVPAAGFALVVGRFIRRFGPLPVLRWGLAAQSAGMLTAALFLRLGIDPLAIVGAMVAASAVTTTRPSQSVLVPAMVDGPDDLTAANVLTGALVAGAGLVGPAIAAVIMGSIGTAAVFAVMAAIVAAAAAAVWHLPTTHVVADEDPQSLLTGIRATVRAPGPRVMVLAISAYYLVIGAYDVLAVVIAVEILGKREAFAGFLATASGAGCLIAGSVAVAVIGRRWIAPWMLAAGFGLAAALVGVTIVGSHVGLSLLVLVGFGVGEAMYELTALMLLQRVSRLDVIGHVFALVEALQMAMLAIGAALVPLAVSLVGSHRAPAAMGGFFAVVVGTLAIGVVLVDRHARVPITEMAALRATPLFGALPGPALETVAREARRIEAPAGEVIVCQGDIGMEYYAVISGHLSVSVDGAECAELGRGDGFGEIALVHDIRRSASVVTTDPAVLLAVDREPFLAALTGHVATHQRASSIAASYSEVVGDEVSTP